MPILIKRYANRKLYNTKTSSYITLKGIARLIDAKEAVQVIDNETGDDITSITLSQILVDSERSNGTVSDSLFSQLLERGGDVLYDALKKGVADASGSLEELQEKMRRVVHREESQAKSLGDWVSISASEFDERLQSTIERVFEVLDLPRHSDIENLNRNLERVANAIERLETTPDETDPQPLEPKD